MRPKNIKNICCQPISSIFKPAKSTKEVVYIEPEELEALNLKNNIGLSQTEAALKMNTSQSTFQRILSSANQKVSDALVNGKEIRFRDKNSKCC